jgi:HK97 family phage prohead protease
MSKPTKQRKKPASQLERRYLPTAQSGVFEIRTSADGKKKIAGYAAKYNKLSEDLGGFREQIDPAAFTANLASNPDVRALWNHDANHILGRTTAGTLRLSADSTGLRYEVDPPDTQTARDLMVSMERGDVTQSSFGFVCTRDDWKQMPNGEIIRTVLEAALFDVSPVTFPAYLDATSGVRAALRSAPDAIRAKLSVRDDSEDDDPDDHPGQNWDEDLEQWVDDDDENERCACSCAACRAAHPNAVNEDELASRAAHKHLLSLR